MFLFGSGGTGDQTRAANMSLSLAPVPSAGHGSREATLQARVYLHMYLLYITIRGEGKGGDRQAAADDDDDGGAEILLCGFISRCRLTLPKQSAGLADAVANQAVHVGWTRERKAKTTMISRCERGRERMGE